MLKETAIHKRGEALPADEALRVPEGVESRDVVLQNGPCTASTLGRKHVKVVLPAIRLPILLMEALWPKERSTLSTEEVFRVPCPVQGSHNFIQYRSIAVVAAWGEEVMVVLLTVGLTITLKEVSGAYLLLTVSAHKVLGVPSTPHSSNHLSNDWLTAGPTHPLGHCLHAQFMEVRLQAAQHVV